MIDKEKTIEKAIVKYHTIFPARGKHSLNECFFRLRGEYFFVFTTKDKKVHTMHPCMRRTVIASAADNGGKKKDSILDLLNKPIIVRSLIVKKPVGTWLINLFPAPGISWSTNKHTSSGSAHPHHQTDPRVRGYGISHPAADWGPENSEISAYSNVPNVSPVPIIPTSEAHWSAPPQHYLPQQDTATCSYEILETGCLPVSSAHWLPALDKYIEYPYQTPSTPADISSVDTSDRWYLPPTSPRPATTYRYEILATGCLPVHSLE